LDRYGLLHIGKTGGTAAKTVLRASRELGAGETVTFFKHEDGLAAIAEGDLCERLMFFIREPTDRFVSAFNSRLRMGYPRHNGKWNVREEVAFEHFKTPNALAEGLSSEDPEIQEVAVGSMMSIMHLRRSYEHYLGSVELLEQETDRIWFIGATETFDADFALMRGLLGIPDDIVLPTDDYGAHRTPDGFDKTLSEVGRRNVRDYYQTDYAIYNWCVKRREALVALRSAEFKEKA
jgi:hypothetical protein